MPLNRTRFVFLVAVVALFATGGARPVEAADALFAVSATPTDAGAPTPASDPLRLVPASVGARYGADAVYAQRAITHDLGNTPAAPEPGAPIGPQYTYVDVKGWKSPVTASGLSLALPGSGQLYAGSRTGYVFLGVEAVAVAAFLKYRGDSQNKRDQYFGYVGDPNQSGSRFSFDRLATTVSPDELARLKAIYAKDPREFYDIVTTNANYATGWDDPTVGGSEARATADGYRDDVNSLSQRSRLGLFVALTNHVASTIDALHLARLNNFALTQNLSLRFRMRPGARQSYGLTLTQKF
jgi:hypothetical protein